MELVTKTRSAREEFGKRIKQEFKYIPISTYIYVAGRILSMILTIFRFFF